MRLNPLIIAAILLVAPVVIAPPSARACSCVPTTIWRSDPSDGSSDVPLNHALVVEGYLSAQSIKLEDANGNPVAFDLAQGPAPGCVGAWAELVPRAALAPMTQYRIRVEPKEPGNVTPDRTSLTFTTGTQMLPEQNLTTPKGRASVVEDIPPGGVACGPTGIMACVGLEDYAGVEMIARRDGEIILRWLFSEDTMDPNFGFYVVPDCLEFRRRAATGQRSAPLTICGASLGTRSFVPSDMSESSVLCRAGVIGKDADVASDGCAAGPRGQAPGATAALLLLAAAG